MKIFKHRRKNENHGSDFRKRSFSKWLKLIIFLTGTTFRKENKRRYPMVFHPLFRILIRRFLNISGKKAKTPKWIQKNIFF